MPHAPAAVPLEAAAPGDAPVPPEAEPVPGGEEAAEEVELRLEDAAVLGTGEGAGLAWGGGCESPRK